MTLLPSYKDKIDPFLLTLFRHWLEMFDTLKLDKAHGIGLMPEYYEKFVKAGCPDWSHFYDPQLNLSDQFTVFKQAMPEEAKRIFEEAQQSGNKNDLVLKALEIKDKFNDEIKKNIQPIFENTEISALAGYVPCACRSCYENFRAWTKWENRARHGKPRRRTDARSTGRAEGRRRGGFFT